MSRNTLRRIHDERWVVSRAWVAQRTGASPATVARWYQQRQQRPGDHRFPEVACVVERVQYYDQEAVESFWAAWRQDVGTGRLQAAGRRPGDGRGNQGGGSGRAQRDKAVATALEALREAGGHRRGLGAQLAREHGGNERTWQRAVDEARALYAAQPAAPDPDTPTSRPTG
ncbi:hypothetical protein GCM10010277_84880 [Streptomyces longisporoflavus]|uniref:hypothetical protein n=1 Tax=Streptomyces longisporoflavus TaxID=28044 RepID=UPI00167E0966|nr:hypothetical protein [Streptomyces longisporoflavus]GGV72216.1 hypothetical protein GCM10010277_84880 [Streptomyces longisporoflavus]